MEQHPVPQNIIDVEFKLFGSFTLKQFSKIVLGCLGAVVIYLIPIIPMLIKVPLILISIGVGILMALISNFGVWLNGLLKAIFISPRYVWIKKETTPELLRAKRNKLENEKNQKVSASKNKEKIDITEVSLDKLFGTKTKQEEYLDLENEYEMDPVRNSNLDRLYSQAYPRPVEHNLPQINQQSDQPSFQTSTLQEEINQLKNELTQLPQDASYKQKEQEIISRINDLYRELKLIQMNEMNKVQPIPLQVKVEAKPPPRMSYSQISALKTTKTVLGIIVDKDDKPISKAGVNFENIETHTLYRALSSADGRFATQELPIGKYNIFIEQPGYKFHTYQVDIQDLDLPAYKFRAK